MELLVDGTIDADAHDCPAPLSIAEDVPLRLVP
jgi:hypothetical protein